MRKYLVLVVAVVALVLAAVNTFFLGGEDTASQSKAEDSEVRLSELENHLGQLEMRLNDAQAQFDGLSSAPASNESTENIEVPKEGASDLPGEISRLHSLMRDLFYRIQALEQDPINRGYTFLNSENVRLRLEGINALRRLGQFDPATREAIRNMLQDPSERVRREAADALGDLGDKDAAPLMAQMLNDPDAGVRREAIDSFADWGQKESAPLIAQMLNDPDANVRREAMVALGTLGARQASSEIAQLLSDSSDGVREQAADVLGRLKATEGTAALLQALDDSNDRVRGEAIASLGEVGAVEAVPYLRDMYERSPGGHTIRLVRALRALGDEEPFQREVQRLSEVALSSDDVRTRGRAVQMLSSFARNEAKDVFTRALEDTSGSVRREAQRALRRR